jgi:hypothetical protein
LLEELGRLEEAANLYQQSLETGLPLEAYHDTLERLALLHKRQGNYAAAILLWQRAASEQQIYAFVELAKYYEHRALDFSEALHWTRAALEIVNSPTFPGYARLEWLGNLEHRLERLEHKEAK